MIKSKLDTTFSSTDLATISHEEFRECQSSLENRHALLTLLETPPSKCKSNIKSIEYKGELMQFEDRPQQPYMKDRYFHFSYTFESMSMTIMQEYYIYDTVGFISSVGGTLGLFIGFSFYDVINKILDYIMQKTLQVKENTQVVILK